MTVPNPIGRWVPDPLAPSGFRWQRHDEHPPTQMLPAVPAIDLDELEDEDHGHVDPEEFPDFSGVDSQMIRSIGAPE